MRKAIVKTLITLTLILFFIGLSNAQSFISESHERIQQLNDQGENFTIVKISKLMKLSVNDINNILAGKRRLTLTEVKRWSTMLRCKPLVKYNKRGQSYMGLECNKLINKSTGKEILVDGNYM